MDAEAVARVALREPGLSKACLGRAELHIKLLADQRRTLVAQRTAIGNKLRWFPHGLDPDPAREAAERATLRASLMRPGGSIQNWTAV
ncbi:hypothetical protein ABZ192_09760 [Streptomyces sp. NPDC006235]|uniref:hypothetical protein n=1 Tax=Streptomyces sp. NPDC006235 TaxID=3156736 RepID=UPI0033A0CA06